VRTIAPGSILVGILTGLLSTLSTAAGESPQGPPPAPVRVATAEVRELAPTLEVPGTVISRLDARLAAEVAGRITAIRDVGESVSAGDTLVEIDDVAIELSLQDARAAVTRAEARVRFLDAEVTRLARLERQNSAAQSQLEQATSDRDVADADLTSAEVSVARIQDQIRRSRMPAPFDGVISERLIFIGERAAVGDLLIRLVDPTDIEVTVRAPLANVVAVRPGDLIRIWAGDRQGAGRVRTVVPFGDARSHMAEIRLDVESGDWRVGESLRVALPTAAAREVLTVPRDALVLRRGGAAVFRIDGAGLSERVAVTVGVGDGDFVEVSGNLSRGDRVVVRGAERLRPGQPVMILEDG
jgi:RND family efflux transporter MFP subunit